MSYYTTPLTVTSQFFFCGLPLRLDTYRGCAFQCPFCFARQRGGNAPEATVVPANPVRLCRIFDRALGTPEKSAGVLAQFLRRRIPVHFGGMSDPFQPAEMKYGVTRAVLKTLASYHYPTVISTRGTLIADSPYIGLVREIGPVLVQFSFSSSLDRIARVLEPKSNPPSALLRCMEKLIRKGIAVSCRWQPYVPGVSERPAEFAKRVSSTGCSHVAMEHLKVPLERTGASWSALNEDLGFDLYDRYKTAGAVQDGRELTFPVNQKLETVLEAATEVRQLGMTFGAADNELQYLSDSSCCCSGADLFPGFENFFKHQIAYAVRQSLGRPITYSTIAGEWSPTGAVDRFLNSKSRIANREGVAGNISDHIRTRWNQIGAPGSPSSFFGVEPTGERVDGMTVYAWSSAVASMLDGERVRGCAALRDSLPEQMSL